jgi:hypothetical protein
MKTFLIILTIIFFILTVYSLLNFGMQNACGGQEHFGYQFGFGFMHLLAGNSSEGCSLGYHLIPIDFILLIVLPLLFVFKKSR